MARTFRPVNIVILNGTIYYSNKEGEVGLIEEEPSMQLTPEHTINGIPVTVLPIPRLDVQIPQRKLAAPMSFTIGNNDISINDVHEEGGEGIIYKATLNGEPVIVKTYVKRPRTLPSTSPHLRPYLPAKYLLFEDLSRAYFVVMQELEPLTYNTKIFQQSMAFLALLEELGLRHGDLSPGNIMQDWKGDLKIIDFSRPGSVGTRFYSKDNSDRKAMARSLLSHKYTELISTYLNDPEARTLFKLYRRYLYKYPRRTETDFFNWLLANFPQNDESRQLIAMAK